MKKIRTSVGMRLLAALLVVIAMVSFVARPAAAQETEVTIALEELNGSGVSGEATITDNGDGTVSVSLLVDGATGGHPVHIHSGSCAELGEVIFPLVNVEADGVSETDIEFSAAVPDFATLVGGGYAINVHESEANINNYVTCGDITAEGQAADAGTEEETDDGGEDEAETQTETEDDGEGETLVTVDLEEINDSGVSGTADLEADGDQTIATLLVDGATGGHPVHIHDGTCDELGAVVYPLADVDANGDSVTTVDVALADLLDAEYAINVHLSADEIETYVACGNIQSGVGGGETDDTETPVPAETPATTTGPDVGVGLTATQSGSLSLLGGLALLATLFMGGALALRRREVRI